MHQFGVVLELEALRKARETWRDASLKFQSDHDLIMARLLHEAAANYMSVAQVAKASGSTPTKIRNLMRKHGLNPKSGKKLLAKTAAQALQENAALLGIEPHEMDLMSPLAYLPMGSELRQFIAETKPETTRQFDQVSGNSATDRIEEHRAYCAANTCCFDLVSP